MVGRAGLLVDKVREDVAANFGVLCLCVNSGKICRERGDMVVVLGSVITQCFEGEFSARPGLVEGMLEQMLAGDASIDLVNNCEVQYGCGCMAQIQAHARLRSWGEIRVLRWRAGVTLRLPASSKNGVWRQSRRSSNSRKEIRS